MYNSAEPPHFGLMRWCYIFNCVYHVLGIYELELWLDTCDYEHLIWPQLLLCNTCDVIWYTGLYTYNSELLNPLLDLPASSSYSFGPAPSPTKEAYFSEYVYNWCQKWDSWKTDSRPGNCCGLVDLGYPASANLVVLFWSIGEMLYLCLSARRPGVRHAGEAMQQGWGAVFDLT